MIVRNEAAIIERCLRAALPFVQSWAIADTGSTDGTQRLIRELLAERPGKLIEIPWTNFATCRNAALELARDGADRILFLDADDVLTVEPGAPEPQSDGPAAYQTRIEVGVSTSFLRTNLVRSDLPWYWDGAVHEVILCDQPIDLERLPGWSIRSLPDGARSQDGRLKFARDAALLEEEVARRPGHARSMFYLAQSYRDAGELEKAIDRYQQRVMLGGWDEEVWTSLLQIAMLRDCLGPWELAAAAYLRAYQFRPTRAEPLVELARHYRLVGDCATALLFATPAKDIPRPTDILFVEDSVYDWRALDEFAIASYWVGQYRTALEANVRLLTEGRLPLAQRDRIETNLRFCVAKLEG